MGSHDRRQRVVSETNAISPDKPTRTGTSPQFNGTQ
jgi:hypothetical protein